jgi:two-component system CheB/CheR fusion protein
MADSSGHVTFCNSKWYEYTGFEKDGNELENWASVFHPDGIESTMELWNHSLQSGEGYEHEYRFASKNHPTYYRWFLARAKPLSDNNGKIICWVGYLYRC